MPAFAGDTDSRRNPGRGANATYVFHHPACLGHVPGGSHPERPARLDAVLGAMRRSEHAVRLRFATGRPANREDVLLCHTSGYLATVERDITAGATSLSTGDTSLSAGSLEAAFAAAGTVISAVDAVIVGGARNAFCAVRPPGHHATPDRGMGFCIFNNVAIGTRHAQRRHGIRRVLIADWDVHHGNGTQEIFWRDGSVLFFDTHQAPHYPGTGARDEIGEGAARGLIINRPFHAGTTGREIVAAFREVLMPAADAFKPDLVMVSAGFDSRRGDPLGGLGLSDDDFAALTGILMHIAARHAKGRLVSVLEGGYQLDGLAAAVAAHVGRMAGPDA